MRLAIKATPNAKKSEVLGWEHDPLAGLVLKVKVAAPPVEGKANKAIIAFLAEVFCTSKSKIILQKGETGRIKRFEILGDDSVLGRFLPPKA